MLIPVPGPMHLTTAFLPHFKSHSEGGVIMNVSSVLGYIPFSIMNPVYNGTKVRFSPCPSPSASPGF